MNVYVCMGRVVRKAQQSKAMQCKLSHGWGVKLEEISLAKFSYYVLSTMKKTLTTLIAVVAERYDEKISGV